MGKFDSNKGRSSSRGDKKPARGAADKDSKGDGYKAKRSFTKNKSFRDGKDTGAERPARSFETRGDKKFDRPFKKTFGSADEKPKRSFGGDGERKPYKKDDSFGDKPKRSFSGDSERKPFKRDSDSSERPRRSSAGADDRKPFKRDSDSSERPRRSAAGSDDRKPFKRDSDSSERPRRSSAGSDDRKPFKRDGDSSERPRRSSAGTDDRKPFKRDSDSSERPRRSSAGSEDRKPFKRDSDSSERPRRSSAGSEDRKPFKRDSDSSEKPRRSSAGSDERKPYKKSFDDAPKGGADEKPKRRSSRDTDDSEGPKRVKFDDFEEGKVFSNTRKKEDYNFKPKPKPAAKPKVAADGMIRLNKYLSNAGVASRRDADNLILSGTVKVNGVVVDQLGSKINPGDKVTYGDAAVRSERKVYLLLNKPKDYITTVDDPQERKTVMELIKGACRERIYPVGRLDRNTTGLLLFTNDGELTTKLTHPKFNIKKVYHVSINKGLKPEDFAAISEGIELEDGFVKADDVAFVGEGKKEIGIEIHSGRNRIVRRIFEHLGYDVLKLDRVVFAGLTKKDLPRGKHRFLTAKEIGFLQMIG